MANKIDNTILAYIAGAMDSDGWFSYNKKKNENNDYYWSRCGLMQTKPLIPKLIKFHFGGSYSYQKPSSSSLGKKYTYRICVSGTKAHKMIEDILPFLRLKKKRAKLVLQLKKKIDKTKLIEEIKKENN